MARPTLCMLGQDELLDELVGGLGVERQRVAEGLQVRAFLQERLLQPHPSGVEVLLHHRQDMTSHLGSASSLAATVRDWDPGRLVVQ